MAGEELASEPVRSRFDLGAAPEPYLPFNPGSNPLVVVTTNPGATMPHQRRDHILAGQSVATPSMSYAEAAEAFSRLYVEQLTNAAGRRVHTQRALALAAGFTGVLQVECCPLHSPQLPGKSTFVQLLDADPALSEYVQVLRDFLEPQPVLAISAVAPRADLVQPGLQLSDWLRWQCDLIGLSPSRADLVPLVWKGQQVTGTALVEKQKSAVKAMVLMKGSNNLPAEPGREIMASALAGAASS